MKDGDKLLKTYFKIYYRSPDREIEISNIEHREIAYQPLGKEVMIRHLAFKSIEELRRFIVRNIPAHIYYSTARYEYPGNPDMEKKVWKGADLVFDIDGDHLSTENCRKSAESGVVCIECLQDTINETLKLIDILENDFGFSKNDYYITFSGHRGFHIHVESDVVLELSQDDRREISDYIRGIMFNIERFLDQRGRIIVGPDLDGIGRRIWRCIENKLDSKIRESIINLKSVRRYLNKIRKTINEVENCISVMIDEVVTLDIKRLIRVPNSLHGKTGLIVSKLDISDLEKGAEHVIYNSIPRIIRRKYLRILLKRRITINNILGVSIDNNNIEDVQTVPAFLGIYLIRRGLADLVE